MHIGAVLTASSRTRVYVPILGYAAYAGGQGNGTASKIVAHSSLPLPVVPPKECPLLGKKEDGDYCKKYCPLVLAFIAYPEKQKPS